MNEIFTIIGIIIGGLFVSFMRGRKKKGLDETAPPKNKAVGIAKKALLKAFKKDVKKIEDAAESNDAAQNLADIANNRDRR